MVKKQESTPQEEEILDVQVEEGANSAQEDEHDDEPPLKKVGQTELQEEHESQEQSQEDEESQSAPETDEQRAALLEKRRREKLERKERREKAIARDKLEMDFLRKRNEELEKRMLTQEMRAHRQDHYTVEQKIAEAEKEARLAEEVMAKAIAEANGDDAARALRFRDEALEKIRQLSATRENLKRTEESVKQPKNVADPVVNSYARDWISKNPWYDINGGDEDSRIVLEIDNRLAQEGYVPRTELYWKELDKRVRRNLPHRFSSREQLSSESDDSQDDEDEYESAIHTTAPHSQAKGRLRQNSEGSADDDLPRRGAKKGPPVGARGEHAPSSTRKEVYISKERKEALIAAGVWDDPVLRTRYVKQYQKWDKENATR